MTPLASGRSPKVSKLVAALAKAQGEIKEIAKNKKVTVTPRTGGSSYDFRYATLSSIIDAIREPLSKNGIVYTQTLEFDIKNNIHYLTTALLHDEEYISSISPLLLRDMSNQQFGSALTYMKRYALAAILGIAPDDDDDGNLADGNEVKASVTVPAPDVIKPLVGETVAVIPQDNGHPQIKIDVPMSEDGETSDWIKWGRTFMSVANGLKSKEEIEQLRQVNAVPMKNMELYAPKMFTNLSMAILRLENSLEKKANVKTKS